MTAISAARGVLLQRDEADGTLALPGDQRLEAPRVLDVVAERLLEPEPARQRSKHGLGDAGGLLAARRLGDHRAGQGPAR
jgi:hypothetical protein